MKNEYFKYYSNEVFNQKKNYEKIISKGKEKNKMKYMKKIATIAAVLIFIIGTGVISKEVYAKIQWNIEFKDYINKPKKEEKGRMEKLEENGYTEILDMDYIKQDGISLKVDSLLITDDCIDINLDFKFDENIKLNPKNLYYAYIVYDENKNVLGIAERHLVNTINKKNNYLPFIHKELGIKYNKKNIYEHVTSDSTSIGTKKINENNRQLISNLILKTSKSQFPRSKKIYIRIEDLGFSMIEFRDKKVINKEDFTLSDSKWIFEIEVPEKFYNRETYELKLENNIPNIEITNMKLTETGLMLRFKSKEYIDFIMSGKNMEIKEFSKKQKEILHIEDEKGNIYKILDSGTFGDNGFKMLLDIGKENLNKNLYFIFNTNGRRYKEKLILK